VVFGQIDDQGICIWCPVVVWKHEDTVDRYERRSGCVQLLDELQSPFARSKSVRGKWIWMVIGT
jgi:hypothetical protein